MEAIEWMVNSGKSFLTGKLTEITEEYKQQNSQPARLTYTRLISGDEDNTIDATDGSLTFGTSSIFGGRVYNHSGVTLGSGVIRQAHGPVKVSVHEQVNDGTFSQVIGGLNCPFFSEHQAVSFVEKKKKWLLKGGYAVFIPFMVGNEELVASVSFGGHGRLSVDVDRFSYDAVWRAIGRRRIVVPQQEPLAPSVP